ncbi:hypothetical protein [Oscillibacter sp. MSJ-31]|uniref:hypothetical protein n=1 Tax=Oscillibacter sp. MSJ-31 TaxID=2841526 RepID=UPI001C110B6B|nr:hypothetical protein [Oscillibacter sp. MSJ-31]MBU5458664.1 hypothetical protein [Oscillibacter sp. MSJ-31]
MARKYMKIRRVVIPFLTLAIMLSQLSGCAVVSPEDIVDNPDDVTLVIEEPDLDTETDKNTVDIDGKQYDISGTANSDVPQKKEVLLTTEELHALFKKEYDTERFAKSNLYADQYKDFYMKLPAREIGTQVDANVYSYIESTVKGAGYEGKILPDDGFEQYVAWREALEKGSSSGNNQSGNNSGNTGNTGNTGGQTQQKPSGGSSNNGGSSGNAGNSSGGNGGSGNVYDDAHITNTVPDNGDFGESSIKDNYEKPSYEIIG